MQPFIASASFWQGVTAALGLLALIVVVAGLVSL
jgi:hypothetical protein